MLNRMNLIIVILMIWSLFPPASFAILYGKALCHSSGYHCKRIRSGQSWSSLWPNEHDRELMMRINRMNTQVYAGMTVAVPDNLDKLNIMDFAPFPRQIKPLQEKVIVVDPENIAWGAYAPDGTLVRWGPISGGSDYCRDIEEPCRTHSGSFRIFSLGSSDCISRKFPLPKGGAPMPYCMYFNKGQALHGEPNGLPGYNASHGCVRLYVSDAEWLRYDFVEGPNSSNDYRGTMVVVGAYDSADPYEDKENNDESSSDNRYDDESDAY